MQTRVRSCGIRNGRYMRSGRCMGDGCYMRNGRAIRRNRGMRKTHPSRLRRMLSAAPYLGKTSTAFLRITLLTQPAFL